MRNQTMALLFHSFWPEQVGVLLLSQGSQARPSHLVSLACPDLALLAFRSFMVRKGKILRGPLRFMR